MKKVKLFFVLMGSVLMLSSCGNDGPKNNEVKIGDQIWMTKNLNVDKFQNGDPIPQVETVEAWKQAGKNGQPAWCYYDNDPANDKKYGKLYNWHAVNDPRGLSPEGWRVPNDEDWTKLADFLGGLEVAGKKLKSSKGWDDSGNGTNSSGFYALPGGGRSFNSSFNHTGKRAIWWSTTENNSSTAWGRGMDYLDDGILRLYFNKTGGYSVRCIKE